MSAVLFHMIAGAPTPVAPFSHATEADGWVFVTGQMPTDPDDDGAPLPDGIEAQTRRVMDNLGAVLEASGSSFENVVKATVYLGDIHDFLPANKVYAEYFPGDAPPARAAFQAGTLPLNARVEIEMIALAD